MEVAKKDLQQFEQRPMEHDDRWSIVQRIDIKCNKCYRINEMGNFTLYFTMNAPIKHL